MKNVTKKSAELSNSSKSKIMTNDAAKLAKLEKEMAALKAKATKKGKPVVTATQEAKIKKPTKKVTPKKADLTEFGHRPGSKVTKIEECVGHCASIDQLAKKTKLEAKVCRHLVYHLIKFHGQKNLRKVLEA